MKKLIDKILLRFGYVPQPEIVEPKITTTSHKIKILRSIKKLDVYELSSMYNPSDKINSIKSVMERELYEGVKEYIIWSEELRPPGQYKTLEARLYVADKNETK
jgi:hypothetical protein